MTFQRDVSTHLHPTGCHFKLLGKVMSQRSIRLCVTPKDTFQDLKLCTGCSLAMLYFVGSIRIKSAEVDGSGILSIVGQRRVLERCGRFVKRHLLLRRKVDVRQYFTGKHVK